MIKIFNISFFSLVCLSSVALGATVQEMANCSTKSNSVERLACFDNLSKAEKTDKPITTQASKGDWIVTSETSKINDKTNVYLSVESDESVRQRYGGDGKAHIWIICAEGQTNFYFEFGNLFLADTGGYGDVTLRVDKQKARVISMKESTDNSALGLWRGSGGKLIKSMFGAKSMFVQITPFNESSVTAEFKISGLEQAISPLRKACNW